MLWERDGSQLVPAGYTPSLEYHKACHCLVLEEMNIAFGRLLTHMAQFVPRSLPHVQMHISLTLSKYSMHRLNSLLLNPLITKSLRQGCA